MSHQIRGLGTSFYTHSAKLAAILVTALVIGCGGYGGEEVPGDFSVINVYVSGSQGSDGTGDGRPGTPFRTITKALTDRAGPARIVVGAGTYDASSGERFPIVVGSGIEIAADSVSDGPSDVRTVRISGGGPYRSAESGESLFVGVVMMPGAGVRDVSVTTPGGVGVVLEKGDEQGRALRVQVQGSIVGVLALNGSRSNLIDSRVCGNTASGVELLPGALARVLSSLICENGVGITVSGDARPAFAAGGDIARNSIVRNTQCDFRHLGTSDLNLVGTSWDDDVFSFTASRSCSGGTNISVEAAGQVVYQAAPLSDVSFFLTERAVVLLGPVEGQVVTSLEPNFSWRPSVGAKLMAAAVFDRPPVLRNGRVGNTENIRWYWHSGLPLGGAGFLRFSEGVNLRVGDLSDLEPPVALLPGRAYYWVVWEWSEDGAAVSASSPVGFFRTQN